MSGASKHQHVQCVEHQKHEISCCLKVIDTLLLHITQSIRANSQLITSKQDGKKRGSSNSMTLSLTCIQGSGYGAQLHVFSGSIQATLTMECNWTFNLGSHDVLEAVFCESDGDSLLEVPSIVIFKSTNHHNLCPCELALSLRDRRHNLCDVIVWTHRDYQIIIPCNLQIAHIIWQLSGSFGSYRRRDTCVSSTTHSPFEFKCRLMETIPMWRLRL